MGQEIDVKLVYNIEIMSNKKRNFYKKIFFLGAVWNFIIATIAIVFLKESPNFLFINPPTGEFFFTGFYIMFFCNVFFAGISYYKFSRDFKDFEFLIKGPARGKILLFIIGSILLIINRGTILLFLLTLGDLIWAVFFLSFKPGRKGD